MIHQAILEMCRPSYTALVDPLEQRYGHAHLQKQNGIELRSRWQKTGETLQQLVADIKRLSQVAYSPCHTELQDSLATEHVLEAIAHPDVKHAVRVTVYRDLWEALTLALSQEASLPSSMSYCTTFSSECSGYEDTNGVEI